MLVHLWSMEQEDHQGVLMRGIGRWLVYSRLRACLGATLEMPSLLGGVRLPPGAKCLDIATGLGWATVGLLGSEPTARVVVLEYDGTILSRTREYLRSHGAASASLCRADAKHLPFSDETFDLVLCLYGLHHFRGYLDALHEIARVLRSTRMFVLIDPIRNPNKPPGGHHGTDVPTRAELDRWLGEAGFEIVLSRVSLGRMKAVVQRPVRIPVRDL
jgi:ubiquinone/menaquinone biosynthesis C-methylase UbiE